MWVSAERAHRRLLIIFTCAPRPMRRRVGMGSAFVDDDSRPWATRVQKIVRGMRPPMRDGSVVKLRLSPMGERIDAVMVLRTERRGDDVRFALAIAARHLDLTGQALGSKIIACFVAECRTVLSEFQFPRGDAVAMVHKENAPMQRLLSQYGWEPVEEAEDPQFEYWGTSVWL